MMEEWPVGVEKFYRDHPLLADELKKADALCEEYLAVPLAGRRRRQSETEGAAEVQARGDDGEDVRLRVAAEAEVYGGEAARKRVALTDGERRGQDVSESVVKRAVGDKVVQELEARDEERAHRYVATVRSVMAALRYHWSCSDKNDATTGEGGVYAETVGSGSGETDLAGEWGDVVPTGEGDATGSTITAEEEALLGPVLDDEMMAKIGSVSKLRKVVKRAKQPAKRRRASNAEKRATASRQEAVDIDKAVAAAHAETRDR
ncbi:hypothetical protein PR002_g19713 [Phytophthora rubi]|uniref:Uncharacterized protein n=1 Tax=Phytophthora rubi TaxID=129364 RepID=A0A6A3JJQ9_9STRA|nr:hypothetical protein PR002_g19713 [Phytophthora rubi]